jgi:hypothetical protein
MNGFHTHYLQSIMALFLMTPELYKDHAKHRDVQGYFFSAFLNFAEQYYNFSEDAEEYVYFGSVYRERAGETNIAGSGSNSYKNYFKRKYHEAGARRTAKINDFSRKYKISLEQGKDERLFLGVREIWDKLDRATDIVRQSPYSDVAERSYSDPTLTASFPEDLNKYFVPLTIRNRVWMKYENARRRRVRPVVPVPEEEEPKKEEQSKPPVSAIMFVPPEGLDEDW